MKRLSALIFSALLCAVPAGAAGLPVYKDSTASVERRVNDLVKRMTLREKVLQLNQYVLGKNDNVNNLGVLKTDIPAEIGSLIYFSDTPELRNALQKHAMEDSRLGIPILFGYDVIHGFRTIFPIPLAQAASWNPQMVEASCGAAAREAKSAGIDWTFSPMVDVAHDPRWGRISEGYGEDPYTTSVFAAAAVRGYQGESLNGKNSIAACLKHYVGYGASEAGRDYVPTEISRQTLWDTYLPPYESGVKAGAATLMSSFNTLSGIPATANRYTLTEVLKDKWGHDGFVVSDWDAVMQLELQGMAENGKEAALLAFKAGLEMDMKDDLYGKYMEELVKEGKISEKEIDEAVKRVLRVKFRLGLFEHPYTESLPEKDRLMLPADLALSEAAAQETMVLLKNSGQVLPLDGGKRILLTGPVVADKEALMGNWSGRGRAADVVDIVDGMRREFPSSDVSFVAGCSFEGDDTTGYAAAAAAAREADAVIVCLGEKRRWSGENCSRSTIALPAVQEGLLAAVRRAGKPVVLLLSSGRPIDVTRMELLADAILEIWQPGTCGGYAVAGILSGRYNPSGKLPVTFPYTSGQIPIYYNRRNSARRGTQGLYQDIPSTPMYEFGHGLSYTEFEYGPLKLSSDRVKKDGLLTAEVTVRNIGKRDGCETVHWFICDPFCHITRPVKELRHFEKKLIRAGESSTFVFEIDPWRDLSFVDGNGDRFLDAGRYEIIVGDSRVAIEVY